MVFFRLLKMNLFFIYLFIFYLFIFLFIYFLNLFIYFLTKEKRDWFLKIWA